MKRSIKIGQLRTFLSLSSFGYEVWLQFMEYLNET